MIVHDLLTEPLISWRDTRRRRGNATLPGVLATLAAGELSDFPSVRAHQLEPWCMFLTQLAAIALRRSGTNDPGLGESDWLSLLLNLTDGSHEPWCLVVEDLSKAAFFQAPVPEHAVNDWKEADYPDDIDILVTAKAHDVKQSRIAADDVEAWILAIVTLQTTQGYSGGAGGYNGICRMKGGYGSRPRIGSASDLTIASRFSRDVSVLLASSGPLLARGFAETGIALVWAVPWNGKESLELGQLAPNFIEICRRLRLVATTTGMKCWYTTSETRRSLASDKTGDVGDAWIPIERSDRGALTVGRRGFHYELLTRVLFEDAFEPAAAQAIRAADSDPILFLASAMARGQGKTEGLHSRVIPLPAAVRRRLGQPDMRNALGVRAASNVQGADRMRNSVLFPALKQLALGEKVVQDSFDARVNEVFFDDLFSALEITEADAQLGWDRRLHDIAWAELQDAIRGCCIPSIQWYRRVSNAESMFYGCLTKHFPTLAASLRHPQHAAGEPS